MRFVESAVPLSAPPTIKLEWNRWIAAPVEIRSESNVEGHDTSECLCDRWFHKDGFVGFAGGIEPEAGQFVSGTGAGLAESIAVGRRSSSIGALKRSRMQTSSRFSVVRDTPSASWNRANVTTSLSFSSWSIL